jgi:hypothetical protein
MGWDVKRHYRKHFLGRDNFEGVLFRIEHSDGRTTNKAIFQCSNNSEWAELYRGDRFWEYDPEGLKAWLAEAKGIALSMNEADALAAITNISPPYPNVIKVYPSGEPDDYSD